MRDDSTTSARSLIEFLLPGANYRVYHADLGRIVGGLHEVIILEYLIEWSRSAPDGWAYRTIEEIEEATLLTRQMQRTARETLTARGILETERRGNPARNFYRINYEGIEDLILESERVSSVPAHIKRSAGTHLEECRHTSLLNTPNTPNEQIYTREAKTEEPIDEESDGLGIITANRLWRAYCRGIGLDQRSPAYLAVEQKNRAHLATIDWASTVIDLEAFEATARYLVRRWEAGSVYATPNLAHVFEAMAEYERWLEAGSPPITRTKAPPLARGNTIPGDEYWRSMAEADMSEAEEILRRATAERMAARAARELEEVEQ